VFGNDPRGVVTVMIESSLSGLVCGHFVPAILVVKLSVTNVVIFCSLQV
jgi:hypothetical protein